MIRILQYGETPNHTIFDRALPGSGLEEAVAKIIAQVRRDGDCALFQLTEAFDHAKIDSLEVGREELEQALKQIDPAFADILRQAAENIRAFHKHQIRESFVVTDQPGVVLGQKVTPLERVGLYVPGGTARYPSSVLMNAIPAKLAGVPELVMVTPPSGGTIPAEILAAACIAGVDRVFRIGGAQAIAALAYGTESVPKVDKIVGPGNAYVAEAKKQVFGQVAIDMIAGPSEILVVADSASDPQVVAADMLSQAEHDCMAAAVLVTDSAVLAEQVCMELERQIPLLPRAEIARASIDRNGKIIVAPDLSFAIQIANAIAPEHLELFVEEPFAYLEQVRNAGSIFMGRNCPEALGDYWAGPNHTLPTLGTARFSSPLSVDDFVKRSSFTFYTREALAQVAERVAYFAEQEGLSAHARSALSRIKKNNPE